MGRNELLHAADVVADFQAPQVGRNVLRVEGRALVLFQAPQVGRNGFLAPCLYVDKLPSPTGGAQRAGAGDG